MDSGHELAVGGFTKVERRSSVGGEEIFHVLARSSMLPVGSGFNVHPAEFPCLDPLQAENVPINLFECVPLVVGALPVKGIGWATMIEARNGFRERSASGVGSSLCSSCSIGLIGAVTAVGLVRPLSVWDRRDLVPSRGREGYVVSPKSGKRVVGAVGWRVEACSSPRDGQGLSSEVGGRGINLLWLKIVVVVVEDGDGEVPLDLCECSLYLWGSKSLWDSRGCYWG